MGKGIFGILESAGLVSHDGEEQHESAPTAPTQPVPSQPLFQQVKAGNSSPLFTTRAAPAPVVLTVEDQKTVEQISSQVFPGPTTYTIFRDFYAQVGGGDVARALKLLMSANPSITPVKIKADIQAALNLVQAQKNTFEQNIEQAKRDRVTGPDEEIARLTDENTQNQQKIVELQQSIARNTQQIAAQQQQKMQGQQAIEAGTARFNAIIAQIEDPLRQAQTLFSSLS